MCLYVCIYVRTCLYMCVYILCLCMRMSVFLFVCVCVCVRSVCMHVASWYDIESTVRSLQNLPKRMLTSSPTEFISICHITRVITHISISHLIDLVETGEFGAVAAELERSASFQEGEFWCAVFCLNLWTWRRFKIHFDVFWYGFWNLSWSCGTHLFFTSTFASFAVFRWGNGTSLTTFLQGKEHKPIARCGRVFGQTWENSVVVVRQCFQTSLIFCIFAASVSPLFL